MKNFNWILIIFTLFFMSCATKNIQKPEGYLESDKTEIIETKNGAVQGIINNEKTAELFAGIPFAKPPVGELRWKEPLSPDNWDGILEATQFAPMAMQNQNPKVLIKLFNAYIHSEGDRTDFAPISEDCLYLNIWRPTNIDKNEKLPVLVYIHGGSLVSGSSWFESYDGETLAKTGLIVVTISYRLGIFGYFASEELAEESPNGTTGNYGLLDQIQALKWINENITAFGGDVSNITIAGESAGSSSVNALCASPLSAGLFRRAIGESSSLVIQVPSHTFRSRQDAINVGKKIMDELNAHSISELRKLPAEELLKSKHRNNAMTVDKYSMPDYPWEIYARNENHEEALLNGFNMNEGIAFTMFSKINKKNYKDLLKASPYAVNSDDLCKLREVKTNKEAKQFYTDYFSVVCFNYPHRSWSKVVSEQGKPVYEYCFTKENDGLSTMHSGEMAYAYGNLKGKIYDESDYYLQNVMTQYWSNFAKYGNPNGKNDELYLPLWETYSDSNGLLLELGSEIRMREDPFLNFYPFVNFDIDKQKRPPTYGSKED